MYNNMVKNIRSAKMGRPVTVGATTQTALRLAPSLVERIDAWAAKTGVGRSDAIRQLIEAGLKRTPQAKPKA